jgi:hypothetical protein
MARICSTVSLTGDEEVTFHGDPDDMLVMFAGTPHVAFTFPNAAAARTWLAVTHGRLMEWEQARERSADGTPA